MAKKDVTIKFKSDTKEAESGINKLTSDINKFAKGNKESFSGVDRLGKSVKGLVKSFAPATLAIGATVAAVKKVNEVVKETTTLYKAQANAEKQLEVAANNNPYLDSSSVAQLKSYASQLQSISTVGDETLLPMMAQLAAAGRTQAEIQGIMSAALDVSASGMMSLDSAVTALNKTYSGTAGQLGNQISQLKTLTKEELQSGKAIDIVAEKFKGMAEETAKATGTSEQLKNAISDFKEEIGASFEKNLSPMRKFFTELIAGWASAKKAKREYEEASDAVDSGSGTISQLELVINKNLEKIEAYNKSVEKKAQQFNKSREEIIKNWMMYLSQQEMADYEAGNLFTPAQARQLEIDTAVLNARLANQKRAEEQAKATAQAEAKAAEEQAALAEEQDKLLERRNKLRDAYDEDLRKTQEEIKNRRTLGEKITAEQEAQELLNVATAHYISMYSDAAFDRSQTKTGMWEGEAAHIQFIEELAAKIPVEEEAVEKSKSHVEELIEAWQTQEEETLEMQKALLDEYAAYLDSKETLTDEEIALKQKLADAQKNLDEQILENQKAAHKQQVENISKTISDVADYIDQFAGIGQQIADLARNNTNAERDEDLSEISKQYTDGIISYEDYCEKKLEIERKAAREEYKIREWEWSLSFLQATANIAQGVAAALAGVPPASYIMAALTAASGAVQIASIVAAKPKPPSFSQGGIVPGSSYSGDRVQANVNSGEMVLTAAQQRNLWSLANGAKSGSVVSMPVTINNTASDTVSASAELSPDGMTILIEKIVNAQMAAGKYNGSMAIAQSRQRGVEYQ